MKTCSKCSNTFEDTVSFCPHDGEVLQESPSSIIGQVLDGQYEVEAFIAQGGMGAVYRARHILLGDRVVIKTLRSEMRNNSEWLRRFQREGQAARRFRHPNSVTVYDLRTAADGLIYMVMEYVEGRTLDKELKARTRFSPHEALEVLEPVAEVLEAAHAVGVVHRDLKPENVMIGREGDGARPVVKLLDLGIAKMLGVGDAHAGEATSLTVAGQLLGTPYYMSPEQWGELPRDGGADVDGRTDIYSLGLIFYEAIAGRKPFEAKSLAELRQRHVSTPVPALSTLAPEVPEAFSRAVERSLAKDRNDRPATAGELIAELRAALGLPPHPRYAATSAPAPYAPQGFDAAATITDAGAQTSAVEASQTVPLTSALASPQTKADEPHDAARAAASTSAARDSNQTGATNATGASRTSAATNSTGTSGATDASRASGGTGARGATDASGTTGTAGALGASVATVDAGGAKASPSQSSQFGRSFETVAIQPQEAATRDAAASSPTVAAARPQSAAAAESPAQRRSALPWVLGAALLLLLLAAAGVGLWWISKRAGVQPPRESASNSPGAQTGAGAADASATSSTSGANATAGNYTEALRYWLMAYPKQKSGGEGKRLASQPFALVSDQQFQLHFVPRESGYLYLFAQENDGAMVALLTSSPAQLKSNQLSGGAELVFPPGENVLQLDKKAGTETIYAIFSRQALTWPTALGSEVGRELPPAEQQELEEFIAQRAGQQPAASIENENTDAPYAAVSSAATDSQTLVFKISIEHK